MAPCRPVQSIKSAAIQLGSVPITDHQLVFVMDGDKDLETRGSLVAVSHLSVKTVRGAYIPSLAKLPDCKVH